jgi:hypothetical protein
MLSHMRAMLSVAVFAIASSAQAPFKPVEIPATRMVPAMPAPMPRDPSHQSKSDNAKLTAPAPAGTAHEERSLSR